ncbi:MAG: hypothetical protein AAFY84_11420 [Pseudomonadota bacterium]
MKRQSHFRDCYESSLDEDAGGCLSTFGGASLDDVAVFSLPAGVAFG